MHQYVRTCQKTSLGSGLLVRFAARVDLADDPGVPKRRWRKESDDGARPRAQSERNRTSSILGARR